MSDSGASDMKSHTSDEGNDEDFSVNAFLSPLGGGRDDSDHHDQNQDQDQDQDHNDDHSSLTRSRTSTLASADITFTLTFETTTNIPFEYIVNSEVRCSGNSQHSFDTNSHGEVYHLYIYIYIGPYGCVICVQTN